MRQDDPSRRPSPVANMFTERHVYLRSGAESRYVVLSRPLQIGVTLALLAVVGWLAFASYSSVAKHLEVVEQSREVARLEGVNKSLRAAAESAAGTDEIRSAAERVPELQAQVQAALEAQRRAEQLAAASAAEAEELRRELTLAQEQIAQASRRAQQVDTEREALTDQLEVARAELDARAGETEGAAGAQSQLAVANQQIEELSAARADLQAQLETTSAELEELQASREAQEGQGSVEAELVAARAQIQRLTAELEQARSERDELAARVTAAAPEGEGAPAEGEAAAAEAEELRRALQAATARILELEQTAELAEAEVAELQAQLDQAAQAAAPGPAGQPVEFRPEVDGAPPYLLNAEEAVAALGADLAAAKERVSALQPGDGGGDLADIDQRLGEARSRIEALEVAIARMKARDAAIQTAMSALAPVPPPPAPR